MNPKMQETSIQVEELLFQLFPPNDNEPLSKLSGNELQTFIILLNHYFIPLRNTLKLDSSITFGLEIECEYADQITIDQKINENKDLNDWFLTIDGSLDHGLEINSPILRDSKSSWNCLKDICSILVFHAIIGEHSAGHIHIGTPILGDHKESWFHFLKLWSTYENVIFRFLYGEFLSARPSLGNYACPISRSLWHDYKKLNHKKTTLDELFQQLPKDRYQAINFCNISRKNPGAFKPYNTIEFRCPNGTFDPVIWQNNVNLLVQLLLYSKSSSFQEDRIEKRHQLILNQFDDLKWYQEIFLEQALELCDLIFTNNLDKLYFLRQYLKSFQVNKSPSVYLKASNFTKK